MEQRDYLKDQFDQIGLVLGRLIAFLLGLKVEQMNSLGVEQVRLVLDAEFDIGLEELLLHPSPEELISSLQHRGFNLSHIEQLASALAVIADSWSHEHPSRTHLCRTIYFLDRYIEQESSTYSFERHLRMEHLSKLLSSQDLTA